MSAAPAEGPYLFDTSAEGWLTRSTNPAVRRWFQEYLGIHPVSVSAITVTERIRGYGMLWRRALPENRERIEAARIAYLSGTGKVIAVDHAVAVVAGEIISLLPDPPTPPRRSHRLSESRQDRLARWRFDGIIAATALVAAMPLLHNNPGDFEAIQKALTKNSACFPALGPLQLVPCSELA